MITGVDEGALVCPDDFPVRGSRPKSHVLGGSQRCVDVYERHCNKGVDEAVLMVSTGQYFAGGISWRPRVCLSMVMLRTSQPRQAVLDVGELNVRPSVGLSEALLRSSEVMPSCPGHY